MCIWAKRRSNCGEVCMTIQKYLERVKQGDGSDEVYEYGCHIMNTPQLKQQFLSMLNTQVDLLTYHEVWQVTWALEILSDVGDISSAYDIILRLVFENTNCNPVNVYRQIDVLRKISPNRNVFGDFSARLDANDNHSVQCCLGSLYAGFKLDEEPESLVNDFLLSLYCGIKNNNQNDKTLRMVRYNLLPALAHSQKCAGQHDKFSNLLINLQ